MYYFKSSSFFKNNYSKILLSKNWKFIAMKIPAIWCIYTYYSTYIYTCNSCNIGMRDLPDVYAKVQGLHA